MYDFYGDSKYRATLMQEKLQQAETQRLLADARNRGTMLLPAPATPAGAGAKVSRTLAFNLGRVAVRISAV